MSSVFAKYAEKAYPHRFDVGLHIHTLTGGRPKNLKVAEGWLATKLADKDDLLRQAVAEYAVELDINVDEAAQKVEENRHLSGFSRDEHGLYVHGYQIKACIKEAANIARSVGKLQKEWGLTRKGVLGFVSEHIFVVEDRIYLGVDEPTDVVQSFPENKRLRIRGISYNEYITDAKIDFTVASDYDFSAEEWAMLWMTAEQNGLGAMRSQGSGRFDVVRWDKQS